MEITITSLGAKLLSKLKTSPENYLFINREGTIYLQDEYAWKKLKETTKSHGKIKSWKLHEDNTITLFIFEHHKILENETTSLSG